MPRIFAAALAAALALAAFGTTASAGGWAVTTLDTLPPDIGAGTTYQIGYTIRQHGVTPVAVEETSIRITHAESGKRLSFPGTAQGPVGHYVADVTFPAAGTWTWDVTQGPFAPHDLGKVTVGMPAAAAAAPAPAVPATQPAASGPNGLLVAGLLLALGGAAVLFGSELATARRPARA